MELSIKGVGEPEGVPKIIFLGRSRNEIILYPLQTGSIYNRHLEELIGKRDWSALTDLGGLLNLKDLCVLGPPYRSVEDNLAILGVDQSSTLDKLEKSLTDMAAKRKPFSSFDYFFGIKKLESAPSFVYETERFKLPLRFNSYEFNVIGPFPKKWQKHRTFELALMSENDFSPYRSQEGR